MSKRPLLLLGVLLSSPAVIACNQELDLIEANQCGNKVREPQNDEDCDGEPNCRPPGGHGECRFSCDPAADCPDGCDPEPECAAGPGCCPGGLACCPTGFACGVDSVCRQAEGEFVVTDASSTPTLGLALGDLDDDPRTDVVRLSTDTTSVLFYGDGLTPTLTNTIMGGPSLPVLGDLTNDGLADLMVRVSLATDFGGGVAVFRSQPDRTLESTTYSAITLLGIANARFATIDALPPARPRELLLFSDDDIQGIQPGLFKAPLVTDGDQDAEDLVGIAVGNLKDEPGSPWQEAAYVYAGDTVIHLLEPCRAPGEWTEGQLLPQVKLPAGFQVLGVPVEEAPSVTPQHVQRLFTLFWNDDDTHLDLVVVTEELGSNIPRLHVAYGLGDGTFNSTLPLPAIGNQDDEAGPVSFDYENEQGDQVCAYGPGYGSAGVPLAFADFNRDEAIDVASTKLLLMSAPGGTYSYRCLLNDTKWTAAVVGHFNGNDALDLVAARQGQTGLDFLDGAGEGTFSLSALPSERAVSHLAAGDFDGDLLADVVFAHPAAAQAGSDGTGDVNDSVFVSFGRAAGSPELPRKLGELKEIEQILPGPIRVADAADEILILTRRDQALRAGIVVGNGDRRLHAPYIFQLMDAGGPRTTRPVWVAYGRFFDDETTLGMAVMTQDPPPVDAPDEEGSYRVWLARSSGDDQAELTAGYTGASAETPTELTCEGCAVAAVDLGDDGIDELVTLGPSPDTSGEGLLSVYEAVDEQPNQGFAWLGDYPATFSFSNTMESPTVRRPLVRDIDRDGRKDLATTAGSEVVIFWNDPSADLVEQWASGQASVTRIEIPPNAPATDIAVLNTDDDRELELAVLSKSGIRLLQLMAARQFQSYDEVDRVRDKLTGDAVPGGDVIAAGDLDGDGVEDLVIGNYRSYRVLRGQERRP